MAQFTSIFQRFRQNVEPGEDNAALLRDADAARDGKDWSKAAGLYKEYLALSPDHCAIWVQLGHCLKEVKNVGLAIEAYKQASTLDPGDFDIYLNLGHAYKVAGDFAQAYQSYRKVLELNPACADASRDIVHLLSTGLVGPLSPEAGVSVRAIYLDITDLIDYLKVNNTLSGIQRVVANLILQTDQYEVATGSKIILLRHQYSLDKFFTADRVLVASLIAAIQSGGKSRDEIDDAIKATLATLRPVELQSGDHFAMVGAFWIYPSFTGIKIMRANGVRFTLFIHDLIQISHPEYVHEDANQRFRHALVDALMLADFVITNSEYVANDVRRFMSSRLNFSVPVKAIPLATALVGQQSQIARPMRRDVQAATSAPFVLSVGTIEVRKNHMYMLRIWEELIAKRVKNIPNLVFVRGKFGWDIASLMSYIAEFDHLGGRSQYLLYVSDRELTYLYENCLFTMFPSFIEGFGLPVGESLAHGKPCIASTDCPCPKLAEALSDAPAWKTSRRHPVGLRTSRHLIALPAWEKEIREGYKPRTWSEFATNDHGQHS